MREKSWFSWGIGDLSAIWAPLSLTSSTPHDKQFQKQFIKTYLAGQRCEYVVSWRSVYLKNVNSNISKKCAGAIELRSLFTFLSSKSRFAVTRIPIIPCFDTNTVILAWASVTQGPIQSSWNDTIKWKYVEQRGWISVYLKSWKYLDQMHQINSFNNVICMTIEMYTVWKNAWWAFQNLTRTRNWFRIHVIVRGGFLRR